MQVFNFLSKAAPFGYLWGTQFEYLIYPGYSIITLNL